MKNRFLGQSNLQVSPIAIGGNTLGTFANREESFRILCEAEAFGINLIDTADVYGDGNSETLIGQYLSNHMGDHWKIGTKVGHASNTPIAGLAQRQNIVEKCEQSLRRMGVEVIDLLQVHHYDDATPLEESIDALESLVEAGKIRYYGFCNYTGDDLRKLGKLMRKTDDLHFSSLQIPMNMVYRKAYRSVLGESDRFGLGLMPYNALARGLFSSKYLAKRNDLLKTRAGVSPTVRSGLKSEVLDVIREACSLCGEYDVSLPVVAIKWLLFQQGVSSIPVGFRNVQQLESLMRFDDIKLDIEVILRIADLLFEKLSKLSASHFVAEPQRYQF